MTCTRYVRYVPTCAPWSTRRSARSGDNRCGGAAVGEGRGIDRAEGVAAVTVLRDARRMTAGLAEDYLEELQ